MTNGPIFSMSSMGTGSKASPSSSPGTSTVAPVDVLLIRYTNFSLAVARAASGAAAFACFAASKAASASVNFCPNSSRAASAACAASWAFSSFLPLSPFCSSCSFASFNSSWVASLRETRSVSSASLLVTSSAVCITSCMATLAASKLASVAQKSTISTRSSAFRVSMGFSILYLTAGVVSVLASAPPTCEPRRASSPMEKPSKCGLKNADKSSREREEHCSMSRYVNDGHSSICERVRSGGESSKRPDLPDA
mmetsp:Transcript_45396/g.82979  ORF Transcript_45396/g.82979 Transcript_45396/m.82979 type:complete len:253 (+) Transcript_45396:790-1548(+)